MDLWRQSIAETVEGFRKGSFTPVEVLESMIDRISEVNPKLNALITFNFDEARENAELSHKRWRSNAPLSEIDGICITVKDNIPVGGLRCTWGSKAYENYIPDRDEYTVEQLRAGGVSILGKTNAPEFTLQGYTNNLIFGSTGNAWNPDLTPGGSSGGAVSCVASGMGAAAIGTDGGGSIRRPCAHTGLYGLKTSPGFIGRAYALPALLGDFETMGPIARSPEDLRMMLQLMAASHPSDRASFCFDQISRAIHPSELMQLKILFVPQFGEEPVDPYITDSAIKCAGIFEKMGHHVEQGDVPFDVEELNDIWNLIGPAGLAWLVETENIDVNLLNPSLLPMVEAGAAAKATKYIDLLSKVQQFRTNLAVLFESYDVILTPSVAAMPWPRAESHPEQINGRDVGPRGHAIFTPFANAGGLPGINVPTPRAVNALPNGCQIVGPFGSDLKLVKLAEDYAQHLGAYIWPELS